jgi:hypothetical protein
MRSTAVIALFALSLLPVTAFAQADQQAAVPSGATAASPGPPHSGGFTREQFIQRAEDRAARRAAAQFDAMDADHDGVLEPAEIRAWRSAHPRGAAARSDLPSPQ